LDVSIVNVAMPTLKSTFNVSMAVIEWITMAYMLALIIFLPLFGRLADIYGRSKLYNIGFVIFSLGSLLCGMASSASFMIASRIIQAVGAGLLQANSVAIITHAFPANERGKAIGIQGAVQAVSMAVGPFVGGVLIATVGWRAIFYINIPIGILGTMAALFILPPNQKAKEKQKVDYLGAFFFASGLAFLVLALNEGVKLGWESRTIVSYFLSSVAFLSLFVVTEMKVKDPLIDLALFRNSTFLIGNVTGMLSYYVLFAVMFLMPFYLEKVLGYSVALTGSLLTPLLLAMAAVAPISGHISDRYGARIMTTSGMLISAVACFSLLFMGESARLPMLVVTMIFLGLGMGLFTPSNNSAIIGAASGDKIGVAGGVLNMMRSLGLIFGVDISGVIFSSLEHGYLAEKGYPGVRHVFSNSSIPMPVKADAFMHGFMVVIIVLLAVNVLSAFLSAVRRGKATAIIDHGVAGTAVISSGFFNGFSQEAAGMALFVALLLFTGVLGTFAASRFMGNGAFQPGSVQSASMSSAGCASVQAQSLLNARSLALNYYEKKYNDKDVSVYVTPSDNHFEAEIRKNGALMKKLSIKGNVVTEEKTGIRDWVFDLLNLVS
ncbi:MAG: MFS transporter, partial [Nitrospiraceae bacterium]|nr:MFS transporter [Nitrospiraceae bacterium]